MGRTACTEHQCLYKGALYPFFLLYSVLKLLSIYAYAFIRVGTTDKPLVYALSVFMEEACVNNER